MSTLFPTITPLSAEDVRLIRQFQEATPAQRREVFGVPLDCNEAIERERADERLKDLLAVGIGLTAGGLMAAVMQWAGWL